MQVKFILAVNTVRKCSLSFKVINISNKSCMGNLKKLTSYQGEIAISDKELNLDLTLLGGQSFRWLKTINANKSTEWRGVAYSAFWILQQTPDTVLYKVYPHSSQNSAKYFEDLLIKYLRLDFNLSEHLIKWRTAHEHFNKISTVHKGVRVLNQEPLENIISFICSQNNHIKRISSMIDYFCSNYGNKIVQFEDKDVYEFPNLDSLQPHLSDLEDSLRKAKFGYRAKFIATSVNKIVEFGGLQWFDKLQCLPYDKAREELIKLPGIGYKVADCICLMSLNHLESVPIDTHIFKIAQTVYLPHLLKVKTVTPKVYDEIAEHFRKVYGIYAGWAQAVLFCSELQQFQNTSEITLTAEMNANSKKKKKRLK